MPTNKPKPAVAMPLSLISETIHSLDLREIIMKRLYEIAASAEPPVSETPRPRFHGHEHKFDEDDLCEICWMGKGDTCDHGVPLDQNIIINCQKCWDGSLDGAMDQAESGMAAHIKAGAPFSTCGCGACEALRERASVDHLRESTDMMKEYVEKEKSMGSETPASDTKERARPEYDRAYLFMHEWLKRVNPRAASDHKLRLKFRRNRLAGLLTEFASQELAEARREIASWKALGFDLPETIEIVLRTAADMAKSREKALAEAERELSALRERIRKLEEKR